MAKRIAVIDDDQAFLDLLGALLEDEGYEPHLFAVAGTTQRDLDKVNPDAIVLDLHREAPDPCYRLLESTRLGSGLRTKPVILCSHEAGPRVTDLRDGHGQRCAILPKPFSPDELIGLLSRLIGSPTPAISC